MRAGRRAGGSVLGDAVADIQLIDVSLRDGNQSLWGATGLTTAHILQIAPVMDRVGFRALDFTSSTHMGVAVRTRRCSSSGPACGSSPGSRSIPS
jgi:hypothetical protein